MNRIYYKIRRIFSDIMKVGAVKRQSLITFIWQIMFTVVGFVSTMYIAQTVGPAILGVYFLFLSYNGIFELIADGGFGSAAVKRISENEEPNAYFSAYFIIRLIFTIIVLIGLLVFKEYFVDLNNAGMFNWLLLSVIVSIFGGIVSNGVAGSGKIGVRMTCASIGNISKIILQVIAIFLGYEAAGLIGGTIAGTFIAALIEYKFLKLHFAKFTKKHIKSLLQFSFWIFLSSGGLLVFSQSDVILIGYFMGNADIGVYRVALQFTTIATFSSYALRTTLWPKVSRWAKNNEMNVVEISLSNALTYSLILAIPAFVGGVLLGKDLLSNFYGTDFADGYSVLIILLGVQVITIFQYFFTMYLDALDMPKESFKVTSIAVFVNIMLNVFLIPVYGINGAAIATFVTMAGNSILSYMILSKHINIKLQLECLMHMVMASFIMSIVIFIFIAFVPITNIITSLLAVFVGGVVYVYSILKMDRQIQKDFENIVRYFG